MLCFLIPEFSRSVKKDVYNIAKGPSSEDPNYYLLGIPALQFDIKPSKKKNKRFFAFEFKNFVKSES